MLSVCVCVCVCGGGGGGGGGGGYIMANVGWSQLRPGILTLYTKECVELLRV